jgi:hypothetical protein
MIKPPALSPEQVSVYDAIQRIRMAWVSLIVVLALFTIGFGAFLYAIFFVSGQDIAKGIVGGIDGILVWSLRTILGNLFPKRGGN